MKDLGEAAYILCIKIYTYCVPIVYFAMSLAKGYNSDPGVDHWTTVKIILKGLRKYFSVMEVIKEFVVKSYVDASFLHRSR